MKMAIALVLLFGFLVSQCAHAEEPNWRNRQPGGVLADVSVF
jgi:hypothetical protein